MQRQLKDRRSWVKHLPFNNYEGQNASRRSKLAKARPQIESLEVRAVMAGDIVISEFLADNESESGLRDEDNSLQDWIEIQNTTTSPINLSGWFLTDDDAELPKWEFPNVTIQPYSFMVIFASEKDRRNPASTLHTNFKLGSSGDYLAVVRPDGVTVEHEYDPQYPAQDPDISYGINILADETVFVNNGDIARYHVPASGAAGSTWKDVSFNHTSWATGPTGIGYQNANAASQSPIGYWNFNDTLTDQSGNGHTLKTATVGATPTYSANTPAQLGGGKSISFAGVNNTFVYADAIGNLSENEYSVSLWFRTAPPSVGAVQTRGIFEANVGPLGARDRGIWLETAAGADPGGDIKAVVRPPLGADNIVTSTGNNFADGNWHHVVHTFSDSANLNHRVYVDGNLVATGTADISGILQDRITIGRALAAGGFANFSGQIDDVAVWNTSLAENQVDALFAGLSPMETTTFADAVETDVESIMKGVNASAYVRVPFSVPTLAGLDSLALRIKYDDGFVAYLNGVEIARRNAGGVVGTVLPHNATAAGPRSNVAAGNYELIDVSSFINVLQVGGGNVLAVQGLNITAGDGDFLVLPELVDIDVLGQEEHFFATPTPGFPNSEETLAKVADTNFDHTHGFYEMPFDLELSTETAGAQIRYTTDGSAPTATTGLIYNGPILISGTRTIRAAAFKEGFEPTDVDTQTYIFLDDVLNQSPTGATPPGFAPSGTNGQVLNYGMDPDIVNSPTWGPQLKQALTAIPTISLVTDNNNLWNPTTGIYVNADQDSVLWERPTSVELINPDGSADFTIDAGLRIRGGFSRTDTNPKHALRLFFQDDYDGALNFPLFGDEGADRFEKVDLRTSQNYSWSFQNDSRMIMVNDDVNRDTQGLMGQPYTKSRWYHLYLNGQYWGLYETQERSEAEFAETYIGGNSSEYDVVKVEAGPYDLNATDGNMAAWTQLWTMSRAVGTEAGAIDAQTRFNRFQELQGLNPDGTRNKKKPIMLDVDSLIDNMIIMFYGGNLDAPTSNFLSNAQPNNTYAIRQRTVADANGDYPDTPGFQFFAHDSEHTLQVIGDTNRVDIVPINGQTVLAGHGGVLDSSAQYIHDMMMYVDEYRLQFADRVHKYFFNGGILTPEGAKATLNKRATEIDLAIIAESARWGDSTRATPYTKTDWLNAVQLNRNWMDTRTANMIGQFRNAHLFVPPGSRGALAPLYPLLTAPSFQIDGGAQHGGYIVSSSVLTMTAPAGQIYYTLDGSDPRQVFTGVATGTLYTGPVNIGTTTTVKARALVGGQWTALNEATYAIDASKLRITEINYTPKAEISGTTTPDDYEFLELQNTGTQPIDLFKVKFDRGIDFTFPDIAPIAPGARVVIARNPAAYAARYPGAPAPIGTFTGNLSNGGERLHLVDAIGTTILDFSYDDGWYNRTDGEGFTLVAVDPAGTPVDQFGKRESWKPSQFLLGNPGTADNGVNPGAVIINEVLANSSPDGDWIELRNTTNAAINIGGWYLTDSEENLTKYQIPAGTTVPANGYLVLNQATTFGSAFTLSELGEDVILTSPGQVAGQVGGYRDDVDFGASEANVAFGLYTKSTGGTDFVAMVTNTPGAANAAPKVGPIVINEMMYNPAQGGDEFIEIKNISGSAVTFSAVNGVPWQFTSGVTFSIPTTTTLQPNEFALVIPSSIAPATFRTKYSIPANIQILGQYTGSLSNGGENVVLSKPGVQVATPDGPVTPNIKIDQVDYQDDAPWSLFADGLGFALSRLNSTAYGNDAGNWGPSTNGGTPGAVNEVLDETPPNAPTNVATTVVNQGRIDVSWSAATDAQTGVSLYRVFRNGILQGTTSSTTFTDNTARPGFSYSYTVSARNGDNFEGPQSAPGVRMFAGVADTQGPTSNSITIRFTEPVTVGTATTIGNYAIPGVTINGASLSADGLTVTLQTSNLVEDQTYPITINGIVTESGNVFPAPYTAGVTIGLGTGLLGIYFDNQDFTGLTRTRIDPTIDFGWGEGRPHPDIGENQFTVRWTGAIRAKYTETYTFHPTTDDGVRLWINDVQVVNSWVDRGDTEDTSIPVQMVAGQRYAIRMEMYENGGGATARLAWASPSQQKEIIPAAQLFPPPNITIGDVIQAEGNAGNSNFVFPLTLAKAFPVPVTVVYSTANGSGVAPGDFTAATNVTATFAANSTTTNITVPVVGDATNESNETFLVNLTNPVYGQIADAQASAIILNDDLGAQSQVFARVFHDLNINGIQATSEPNVSGVSGRLFSTGPNGVIGGGDDVLAANIVSDAAGYLSFPSVAPGNYYVEVTLPAGYVFSPRDQGGNDAQDSDINTTTGQSSVFALAAGQLLETLDVGMYKPPVAVADTYTVAEDGTLTAAPAGDFNQSLITAGATWKYFANSDQGPAFNTSWKTEGFNDSAWPSGASELGYRADNDPNETAEATQIPYGPDVNNKWRTYYFRRTFEVQDVSKLVNLALEVVRDDAVSIYINGIEVVRNNFGAAVDAGIGDGAINWSTFAQAAAVSGAEESNFQSFNSFWGVRLNPADLHNGTNTIAVEVHQNTANSSDVSFNLRLIATLQGFGVTANDSAGSGTGRLPTKLTDPLHGALTFNADGSFTYVPHLNYSGPDSFTYKINNGIMDSAPATVTINVTPVNDPPTAVAGGPYIVAANTNLTLDGSGSSDETPDAGLTFAWDLDYDGVNFQSNTTGIAPTVSFASAGLKTIALRVTDPQGLSSTIATTVNVTNGANPTVVGRHLFYNQSRHDGNSAAAGVADDGAIATDKTALLPGGTATFANVSSYTRGINGLMVDIANLPGTVTAGDFDFKIGNNNTVSGWAALPTAPTVSIRAAAGVGGSTRVTLIWPSGAIIKQWLQVTVKANGNTGLNTPDVFYYGNAMAESGNGPDLRVTVSDEVAARNNPYSAAANGNVPAPVTNKWDYNRDGNVSVTDQTQARANQTTVVQRLQIITVPSALSGSGLVAQGLDDAGSDSVSAEIARGLAASSLTGSSSGAAASSQSSGGSSSSAGRLQAQALSAAYAEGESLAGKRRLAAAADEVDNDLLELLSSR